VVTGAAYEVVGAAYDIVGAAEAVGSAIGSTAQGVESAVGSVAHEAHDIANAGVKKVFSELSEKAKELIGSCDKACFKGLVDATQKRIADKKSINIAFISHTAFAHFHEATGGLKKMLIGLAYNSLNGLFDWAMPNIRRHLRSQYGAQFRPMFQSKTAGIQNALLKYSSVNIFEVMQNILTDSLRHSIHSACSVLPSVSFVVEIDFPPHCEIIVQQVLRGTPWIHGIVRFVATIIDKKLSESKTAKAVFEKFHAAMTKFKAGKKEIKELLASGTAVSVIDWLNQPIGTILDSGYQELADSLKEIALLLFTDPHLDNLRKEATDLAATKCETPDVMCKLDTLANLFFILFDKSNVQMIMSQLIYQRMDHIIYEKKVFDFIFNAFGNVEADKAGKSDAKDQKATP